MQSKLYHFCEKESAENIISDGFVDGEDGLVWFAKHPTDVLGESSRDCLLSLTVSISNKKLETFSKEIEGEEEYDNETDKWIPCRDNEWNFKFYAIPSEIINKSILKIVIVSETNRKKLMQ